MNIGTIFWVLIIISVVFGLYFFGVSGTFNWGPVGMNLLQLVLFCLLGWKVFGPVVKG